MKLSSLFLSSALFFPLTVTAEAFETSASHAIIMDADSGIVLFEKNARAPMVPASMTKMMTVYLLFERLSDGRLQADDLFDVSENAWRKGGAASGGSTMFLEPNSRVSVIDLVKGIIVASGNDACIVVAENISGSEDAFAREMTSTAKRIGLSTAEFQNPSGLYHDEHRISALDLAELARLTEQNFPELYELYALNAFEWNGIRQPNRNPILGRVDGTTGLKTGHLEISGYGFTGAARIDDKKRIIVINGTQSIAERRAESERIMRAAFREFDIFEVMKAEETIAQLPIWLGDTDTVDVMIKEDLRVGIEVESKNTVRAEIVYDAPLVAPIVEGQIVGSLIVTTADGKSIERDLVALENVAAKGFVDKALAGFFTFISPNRGD